MRKLGKRGKQSESGRYETSGRLRNKQHRLRTGQLAIHTGLATTNCVTEMVVKVKVCSRELKSRRKRRQGIREGGRAILLSVWLQVWGNVVSSAVGSGVAFRPPKNLVHFICDATHLVKGKFSLFIDNYSDTNKPTILRISWKPQIKLHNNVISIGCCHECFNKETNVSRSGSDFSRWGRSRSKGMSPRATPHFHHCTETIALL